MNLTISVKQLGKKHPLLQEQTVVLDTDTALITVRTLITLVVQQQIDQFNTASFEVEDVDQYHFPKDHYLPILTDTGKIGFGALYNHNKPDVLKAQETALQAFEDGMYVIFYGEEELTTLEQEVNLNDSKTATFIRLTFLVGSYW